MKINVVCALFVVLLSVSSVFADIQVYTSPEFYVACSDPENSEAVKKMGSDKWFREYFEEQFFKDNPNARFGFSTNNFVGYKDEAAREGALYRYCRIYFNAGSPAKIIKIAPEAEG